MSSSSSEKKTIKINPELFQISKTQKASRKSKSNIGHSQDPIIPPNMLRKKLLDRIKKHKQGEAQRVKNVSPMKPVEPVDELQDSMQYLHVLASERKLKATPVPPLHAPQTFKNYVSMMEGGENHVPVQLELPETLQSPSAFLPPIQLKYNVDQQ